MKSEDITVGGVYQMRSGAIRRVTAISQGKVWYTCEQENWRPRTGKRFDGAQYAKHGRNTLRGFAQYAKMGCGVWHV